MRPVIDLSSAHLETGPLSVFRRHRKPCATASSRRPCRGSNVRLRGVSRRSCSIRNTNSTCARSSCPPTSRSCAADTTLTALRDVISGLFHKRLRTTVDVIAHRLTAGQRIRIHDDYLEGGETPSTGRAVESAAGLLATAGTCYSSVAANLKTCAWSLRLCRNRP